LSKIRYYPIYIQFEIAFLPRLFLAWNTFIDKEENFTWEYFLSSPLWMNKTTKIENKPVVYEDWFRKGMG
jgi:hypothetical protein